MTSAMVKPMASFNNHELRLKLHEHIWSVLNDLAIDETLSDAEVDDVRESMEDLADMLLDTLQVKITAHKVEGDHLVLSLDVSI